jgi:hypothetical protein
MYTLSRCCKPMKRTRGFLTLTRRYPMRPHRDPWWHAIPAALSWVMNVLIEGFAAYGAAMEPGFFQPYERDPADWQASQAPLPGTARDRDAAISSIDPGDVAAAREVRTAGWRTWIRSPLAWLLGSRWQANRAGLIISGLDDLDDRTRQDIGYRDYEIAYFACRRRQRE